MKQFTIEIPDSSFAYEPEMWNLFIEAMQMALNRMVVGHMKYHMDINEKFMDCCQDKVAFIRQRLSMYSGSKNNDVCDCGTKTREHSPSCFMKMHGKKLNSGNTENLLDVANGCFCEFIRPDHPKVHFRSQDSKESPGLIRE